MSTLKQKLKKMLGWSAFLALIAGLILPALIATQQAKALDLEFNLFDEEEWCADHEDSWVSCSDSGESTSFINFDGEFAPPSADGYAEGITQTSSAREFVVNVTNFVLSFLGLAAVIVIIYGGFLYVTAGGEQEKADKGKKSVMYAIMGIIIVLISYALVNTIIQGAASGEDVTSSGGLYSAGGVSSEALTAFQAEAMAKEIQAIGEDYMAAYTTYVNVAAILDAMANIGYFGEDGLKEYKEGFDLIGDQVESLSEVHDIVQEATIVVKRYISVNNDHSFWGMANILNFFVPEAQAEDEYTQAEEEEACKNSCSNTYNWFSEANKYWGCRAACTDEAEATAAMDPYEVGSEVVSYVADVSWNSYVDFQNTVGDLETRLTTLQSSFTDLTTIYNLFGDVIGEMAAYQTESAEGSTTYSYDYLADNDLQTIGIPISPPGGSSRVGTILEYLNTLHGLVKELEFTTAIITANTKEGNAPLTVTFNGLQSYDPTEFSLEDEQYEWDLKGNGYLNTLTKETGLWSPSTSDDQLGSSVTYTYTEPGTYRVALRVVSYDPTQVAAGISYLNIKVNPPSSVINLTAQCSLSTCNEKDLTEDTKWTITREDASSGITFDASGTTDGAGNYNTIVDFKFDFGDGTVENGESASVTHYYSTEGEYNFQLEVTDQNGVKDRKKLKLVVSSPAVSLGIEEGDEDGEIGDEMIFVAEAKTDNGTIDHYIWSVTKDGEAEEPVETTTSTPNIHKHTFDEAGIYTIKVEVTDSADFSADDSLIVTIDPNDPAAAFDYKTPDTTHPNRIHFDASNSTDPDGGTLTYEWAIDADTYEFVEGTNKNSKNPIIDFTAVDDYDVTLTVYNDQSGELQKSNSYTRKISVSSILSIEVEVTSGSAMILGSEGTADVELSLYSGNGVSFKVDWADDTAEETIPVSIVGSAVKATHKYDAAGTYPVSVTVYDSNNKTNKIVRNVYIGNGESPIPIIRVYVDNVESADVTNVKGNRKSSFRFDAGDSLDYNGDAITDTSAYSWDFGDGSNPARGERITYKYDEIGSFTLTLTVKSQSAPTPTASVTTTINIENASPVIYSLTVTPDNDELVTPLPVSVSVNASDPDSASGKVSSYKFWYYDVDNSSKELDTQITTSSNSKLTVNTNGTTGESKTYGFVVEVTDEENNTVSSLDYLPESSQPTLEVENGTNISPVADFTVDRTSIMIGESVKFVSSSYDEDGTIVSYTWDVDGDGFFNDSEVTCVSGASSSTCQEEGMTKTVPYEYVAKDGIEVRLKVKDDRGSTDTSDPIKIYVDSLTEDPTAAFDWGVNLNGDNPFEVWFDNMSTADINNGATLESYEWDFDLATSSNDGDDDPDNDIDSTDENGLDADGKRHVYDTFGDYQVRLTVYDNEGNSDSIDRWIKIVEVDPPEAIFAQEIDPNNWLKVKFKNNSKVAAGADPLTYSWDFDMNVNSDDENGTDDDEDSTEKSPTYIYEGDEYQDAIAAGKIKVDVQLTVTDDLGRSDTMKQTITLEEPIVENPDLKAYFTAYNQDESRGGIVPITGDEGDVTFGFYAEGVIGEATFCIDQDDDYNSDGSLTAPSGYTVLNDDCDPNNNVPEPKPTYYTYSAGDGEYVEATYHFHKSWANNSKQIKVMLTATDEATAEESSRRSKGTITIQFEEAATPGSTSMLPVTSVEALYILAIAFGFTLIGAKIYIKKGDNVPSDY